MKMDGAARHVFSKILHDTLEEVRRSLQPKDLGFKIVSDESQLRNPSRLVAAWVLRVEPLEPGSRLCRVEQLNRGDVFHCQGLREPVLIKVAKTRVHALHMESLRTAVVPKQARAIATGSSRSDLLDAIDRAHAKLLVGDKIIIEGAELTITGFTRLGNIRAERSDGAMYSIPKYSSAWWHGRISEDGASTSQGKEPACQ